MRTYCHYNENIHAARLVKKCKIVLLSIPSPHIIMLDLVKLLMEIAEVCMAYPSTMDCTPPRITIFVNTKYGHGLKRFNMV